MIEKERKPSVVEDDASWLRRLAEIDVKPERLLDLRLDGDITPEQLRVRSTELKDARHAVEEQLEAARSRLFASKTSSAAKVRSSRTTPSSCRRGWPNSPWKREIGSTRQCVFGSSPTATTHSLPIGVVMSRHYLDVVS
jgi:hypothetical protein